MSRTIIEGDCLDILPTLPAASFDCCICDPPYPCIRRSYGWWTEEEWHAMMDRVVSEVRRLLKPNGSAVFILQPNMERVGRMRPWLWQFMAKWCVEWNMVQDVWWWKHDSVPTVHTNRNFGLCRPSVKACVWLGPFDCFRQQERVLMAIAHRTKGCKAEDMALRYYPSGMTIRKAKLMLTAVERGGSTPKNLLPIGHDYNAEGVGHGAGTPLRLVEWWLRYICPEGGSVLDPFVGSGTTLIAAAKMGLAGVGIEREPKYVKIARRRLAEAERQGTLWDAAREAG